MSWRLLIEDGVGAASGLAGDEVLARRAGGQDAPPVLRLYTYRPHCALVGRFQDVACEVDADACARLDIEINRRPTGGGAILMGPDQLGVALALRGRGDRTHGGARQLMRRFSAGLVQALGDLGIEAVFRGKNDLAVDGRKIAGLGIHREASGGLLFHASLLVDLDVPLMLRVLKTPADGALGDDVAAVRRRIATVRGLRGGGVTTDAVRECVARGFAASFGVSLEASVLGGDERAAVEDLVRTRYATDAWLQQTTSVPDGAGAASVETRGGRLDVRATTAGRTIKAVLVRGDFFATEAAIADLEGRLRWHVAEAAAVTRTVGAWARDAALRTVTADDVTRAVLAAVADANGAAAPYGCFANPGEGVS